MNKTFKVIKFQLRDTLIPLAIFYGALLLLTTLMSMQINVQNGSNRVTGLEFASVIFIFIAGLNCFKTNFKFLQFFHVSRRTFYFASALSLLAVAAGMTIIDTILGKLFALILPYHTLFETAYGQSGFLYPIVWEFALLTMFAVGGWFITMLYYRSNKILKLVISLSPIYVPLLFRLANPFMDEVMKVLAFLFGFSHSPSWINVLGMTITVLIVLGLNFLLIRRAPVKN